MKRLRRLNLTGTNVTDRGLAVLRDLPDLRAFTMTWHRGISDAGMAHLAHCEAIENVDLMGSPVGDSAVEVLTGKLRACSTDGRDGRPFVPANTRLAGWDPSTPFRLLVDGPITNAGLGSVAALEGLAEFDVFWHATNVTGAGFGPLVRLPHLVALVADARAARAALALGAMRPARLGSAAAAGDEGYEFAR